MAQLVYYILIKPLSLLPYWILYRVSDVLFVLVYYLIRHRRNVVTENIRKSFPELSKQEQNKIARTSYVQFCDLIIESVKNFSISETQAKRRAVVVNPEIADQFYKQGRSVALVLGHNANWEIMAVGGGKHLMHDLTVIFHPLKNKFFNKKVHDSRSQFGTRMVSKEEVAQFLASQSDNPIALVFVADQSPVMKKGKKVYWTNFMNQDTPIAFGPEMYAKKYNLPVIFAEVKRVKRGFYEAELRLLEADPRSTEEHDITERHVRALEDQIRQDPRHYLWTHKRWKHKRIVDEEAGDS